MDEEKQTVRGPRDHLIAFKIDEVGYDWIKWRAKFEGLSVSELMRAVMAGYCSFCINLPLTDMEKAMYSAGQFVIDDDAAIEYMERERAEREQTA